MVALATTFALPVQTSALPAAVTPTGDGFGGKSARRVVVHEPLRKRARHREIAASTVLSGDALQRGRRNLSSAIATSAGVVAHRSGGVVHDSSIRLRAATAKQVRWSLEDLPLQAPDGQPFSAEDIPMTALSRVEIYRGGSPGVLGGQAIGGAVSMRLRRVRAWGGAATVGFGEFDTQWLDGAVGWGGGDPGGLGGGLLAVRLARTDGNYPYRFDAATLFDTSDDEDRERRNNAITRASAIIAQRAEVAGWMVRGQYLFHHRDQQLPGMALYEANDARHEATGHVFGFSAARRGFVGTNDRLVIVAGGHARSSDVFDRKGELGAAQALELDTTAATLRGRWHSSPYEDLRWMAGVGGEFGQLSGVDRLTALERPDVGQRRFDATLGAAFDGVDDWVVHAQLAGGWMAVDRTNYAPESAYWTDVESPSRGVLTGLLSTRWKPLESVDVTAAVSVRARNPDLQELYGNDGTVVGNALLVNEAAWGGEFGVSWGWRGKSAALGLAARAFRRDAEDLITLVRVSPVRAVYQNIGASTTWGGEVSGVARIGGWLRANGAWTMTRARDSGDDPRYAGNPLPMTPISKSSARLELQRGLGREGRHRVGLYGAMQWRAGHFSDRAALIAVPASTLLDVGIWAKPGAKGLRIGLRYNNVLDATIYDLLGYPLPRRALMFTVGVDAWGRPS